MTVGEIIYRILGDDTQFNSVMGKVGATASKALGAISKAALAATGAAAAAVGALAKEAVASFADYEQLAGGAKLMFGDAYDYIAEKAKTAFKDVQMSQNEYLEQVNGFAIGLKTALGGDELAAAKLADRIVTAEADIVAATGNTAENIQNAFNGIMKNNYTMLDNLQIGITPTKEGFQELIDKVNAYKEAQGEATNYTIDNLADCQNALVDYIEMQGLSGYAQAEGAETLSGSMASMKAAWQNMLTGMADPTQDFDELVSNLVDSVLNVSENLMPRIMAVLPQMATGITELAGELLPLIPETLNAMLPGVLEGANNLVSALLETLSSIADTAIPIVTENADEIIDTLLTGLVSAVPKLASSAADLCTALITAILENADIITQGAVDIVLSLAEGIGNNLDTLIPAAVDAVLTIADTLIYNIDELIEAAETLIIGLADGLINSIPVLLEKAPVIITELNTALIEAIPEIIGFAVELCGRIAENIINYDWNTVGANMYDNMQEAFNNAMHGDKDYTDKAAQEEAERIKRYSSLTAEEIDKMSANATKKLGELNSVFNSFSNSDSGEYDMSAMPKWMRTEMEMSGKGFEEYFSDQIGNTEQLIEDLAAARENAVSTLEETKGELEEAAQDTVDNSGADSEPDPGTDGIASKAEMLEEALADLEHRYKTHKITEEQYWAERKNTLEMYRDDNSEEWNELYDKVTEHYDKLAETESKAAEKAAKEQETALKNAIEDKFRELETEQLEKDYDDSWLLEQERAYLETLDHNSEAYKDYNLRLLKEQEKTDSAALKEAEQSAKKQKDAVEKAYNSVVSSRDKLSDSLKNSTDIFQSSEETDKRTGEKKKSRSIDISEFEKKLAAKKKLTEKIAELYEKDVPDSLVSELLKQDPEDALAYANQLLKDPKKLSKIRSMFKEDEGVSNIIANMVTENSSEFEKLGTDAGALFGESFSAAFKENWENALSSVFGEEYIASAAVTVSSANAQAGRESTAPVSYGGNTQSAGGGTSTKKADTGGNLVYKILDLNGSYVAKVVREENNRRNTVGGG